MSTHMLLIKGMPTGAYIDVGELRAALATREKLHEYLMLAMDLPLSSPSEAWQPSVPLVRRPTPTVGVLRVVSIDVVEAEGWEFIQLLYSPRFDGSGVRALFRRPLTRTAQEAERS